jgi:phosphatidyl-myo-inositol dimannoside synthase
MHRLVQHATRLEMRVVARGSPGAREFDRGEGLDVRRAGQAGWGPVSHLALNARALLEARRFRPQAVLSAHIVAGPAALTIGKIARVPAIQYVHADELRMNRRLVALAMRSDAVVAVSTYAERLAVAAGADPSSVHRIPNGVDLPASRRSETAERPTLITVARLEDTYKGHDVLMRALSLVRERVPDVEWLVVGDGSLRPRLERLASEQEVEDSVRFLGTLSDAERDAALDRAHVFAMPSRLPPDGVGGEGFGIVYLEAGAHGLPAVAGNVGGAVDAVVHGETGLLVDPEDPAAVARAISDLLLDPARARALGEAGARRAQRFNWPEIAGRLEDLIFELVEDGAHVAAARKSS